MNTNHLDQESVVGYVTRTLDDAQREQIDSHSEQCQTCCMRLTEEGNIQSRISNELSAVIKRAAPSSRLSFAGIENQLGKKGDIWKLWRRLELTAPVALSLAGLLLSAFGLLRIFSTGAILRPGQSLGAFPTVACFLFMLASVEEFERSFWIRPRLIFTVLVAAILWIGSAFIGLLNIIVIRDLAIMMVVALGGRAAEAGPVAILAVMGAVLLYIGVVIGGADYHYRNIGQPGSWKLFSITLLGQLFILILPYLML
jgi:hypothetical protein